MLEHCTTTFQSSGQENNPFDYIKDLCHNNGNTQLWLTLKGSQKVFNQYKYMMSVTFITCEKKDSLPVYNVLSGLSSLTDISSYEGNSPFEKNCLKL